MFTSLLFEGNYKNLLTGASPSALAKSIYYKLGDYKLSSESSVVLPFCLRSVLRGSHTKEKGMSVVLQLFLLQVSLSTKYTNHQF